MQKGRSCSRKYTSRCGYYDAELKLWEWVWKCSVCRSVHGRNENVANSASKYGILKLSVLSKSTQQGFSEDGEKKVSFVVLSTTGFKFDGLRPGYNPNDKGMVKIICNI